MIRTRNLNLFIFFIALTVVLTIVVVYAWESFLMTWLYSYVESYYPGPQNADYRWRLSQRIEHFFISIVVDSIVVTLLLRLVDKRQRELRESEQRYRALFEHANDGIGVVNADLRLVDANNKFGEILGYQPQALVGKHIGDLFGSEGISFLGRDSRPVMPDHDLPDQEVTIRPWSGERELIVRTAKGEPLPLSISNSTLATGKEQLFILMIRDLTVRKRLEKEKEEMQRQLFQASKLASIGELSAGVAHEINNPLNGIVNFAQLLKDDNVARNDVERQMIDGIIEEGDRIAKIVRNLLTFARQDPHQPKQVDILEVVNNSVSLFGHKLSKDGISVEINITPDVWPVLADASRLRQVVVNMISNAHHALKSKAVDGKLFRISARNVEVAGEKKVRLEFFDNGTGIKRETMSRVFDPFFTTRRDSGGTGLGLSLSFGIIRDYGGTITVDSQENNFTLFAVELPAAAREETEYAESIARRRRAEHPLDDGGAA